MVGTKKIRRKTATSTKKPRRTTAKRKRAVSTAQRRRLEHLPAIPVPQSHDELKELAQTAMDKLAALVRVIDTMQRHYLDMVLRYVKKMME